jgi:hypothetical protein
MSARNSAVVKSFWDGTLLCGHAPRQVRAVVVVGRRVITSVIAQYTRDSAVLGRCSWSRIGRRYIIKIP